MDAEMDKGNAARYGVGPRINEKEEYIFFKFYQWIVPMLLLNALFFYLPRAYWKIQERGVMNKLLDKICK